ncbi:MAG TPA: twin-arginine translocase subunit TatC [Solirubrobacteraceae bacterium]|nr:twin-arginine translocase subunit TatC [Solirubrobacteraceae bacterium]
MATAIRTIGHEERLSLVDHLEELRTRLIVCAIALALAFGLCLWQNHALLRFINAPLDNQTRAKVEHGEGPLGQAALAQQGLLRLGDQTEAIARLLAAPTSGLPAPTRARLLAQLPALRADLAKIPRTSQGEKPITLGIGEPFTSTLTVALYFALLLALPVILFELYGFLLPAFNPSERRLALPLLLAIPFLFVLGAAFGYLVVLPAGVRFFQNFNSSEFNSFVQAGQYYRFAATILLAMGLVFQVPVAILAAVRLGIVTPAQLRRNRRYALLACAVLAAILPGDLVTLALEMIPLYALFEVSILLAALIARPVPVAAPAPVEAGVASVAPGDARERSVHAIIDHTDPELTD